MNPLDTLEQLDACLAASEAAPVFVFKHSTTCPVSAGAYRQLTAFLDAPPEDCPVCYIVKVIESRPVSNAIAERLGVRHESPQLILVKNREAVWNTSHGRITTANIAAALEQLRAGA